MTRSRLFLTAVLALAGLQSAPAAAQIDPGDFVLYQGGREAGEVFVPAGQDPAHYVEYWFLYEGFAFVDVRTDASFALRPAADAERDLDVWMRAAWAAHPKGRLMESWSTETREFDSRQTTR
ncbi:MAG: hypothetical protein V4850_08740 [Myxococcota bacterium]